MSRGLTAPELALLKSPDLKINSLLTFFLDEGTYRFCDENSGFDLKFGATTYLGANVLFAATDIRSGTGLSAEPVTLTIDGNRMAQAGVADPGRVLNDILGYLYQQRRVDMEFGLRYPEEQNLNLIIPVYAGKINTARLIDKEIAFPEEDGPRTNTILEIVLDSLAARYGRATNRLRSHNDQLEIDPTDQFFSFTVDVALTEQNIYWGRSSPMGGGTGLIGTGGGGSGSGTVSGGATGAAGAGGGGGDGFLLGGAVRF